MHVIPRLQLTHLYGAASVDFLPQQVGAPTSRPLADAASSAHSTDRPAPPSCPSLLPPDLIEQDPAAYVALIEAAEGFIQLRALSHIGEVEPPPVVHLVKVCWGVWLGGCEGVGCEGGVGVGIGVGGAQVVQCVFVCVREKWDDRRDGEGGFREREEAAQWIQSPNHHSCCRLNRRLNCRRTPFPHRPTV